MSQLGKKKGRLRNFSGEHSTDQQEATATKELPQISTSLQALTSCQASDYDTSLSTHAHDNVTMSITPEVSDLLRDSDSVLLSSESEYFPTPEKRRRVAVLQQPVEAASLGKGMFVCLSSQVSAFLDQVNANMACRTPGCSGVYVPVRVVCEGLGGGLKVEIACNGCKLRRLTFDSSPMIESSRRTIVSLALQVAFYTSGCTHAQYYHILKQSLGVQAVTFKPFYEMIKLVFPYVSDMINEMCTEAMDDMEALPPGEIGSMQRAIVTGDGTWLTRGHFSKNHTYTIRNYMTGALLYVVHVCMRGEDDVVEGELYKGTAKSAEGYAADEAFGMAKDDGMHVEVQWQDADSSSSASFRKHYPDETKSRIMLCAGHVGRCHTKALAKLSQKKIFTKRYINKHKESFPEVGTVKCCCEGGNHSQGCGCMSDGFLRQARINFFCCLVQSGKDPDAFAKRLCDLGKYHARNIHNWEGGSCDFHSERKCTCGSCEEDEVECEGREYATKNPLTCPLHALAYEIECNTRAARSHNVIHPELGKGHSSNLCEGSHNVLIRFRSKDLHLHRLHYVTSTNLGLCQSNMTYLTGKKGTGYHWLLDLFGRLKLPILDGMQEALEQASKDRKKKLEKLRSEESKKKRIKWKNARDLEQQERKRWVKQQEIRHDYGEEDGEDDPEVGDSAGARDLLGSSSVSGPDRAVIIASKKKCKCGSTTHLRTSHRECPMNKSKRHEDDSADLLGNSTTSEQEITTKSANVVQLLTFVLAIETVP